MHLDYVIHTLYTQLNCCALVHGRQSFYTGGWVENQSMAEPSGGHPYVAFFFFWTQGRIHFSTTLVVRQGI